MPTESQFQTSTGKTIKFVVTIVPNAPNDPSNPAAGRSNV
jgi:hypothetical protein